MLDGDSAALKFSRSDAEDQLRYVLLGSAKNGLGRLGSHGRMSAIVTPASLTGNVSARRALRRAAGRQKMFALVDYAEPGLFSFGDENAFVRHGKWTRTN